MATSPEHLKQVKAIFEKAIDLDSQSEREAFLEDASAGLDEIRSEVNALLAQHETAEGFLDRPAAQLCEDIQRYLNGEPRPSLRLLPIKSKSGSLSK